MILSFLMLGVEGLSPSMLLLYTGQSANLVEVEECPAAVSMVYCVSQTP